MGNTVKEKSYKFALRIIKAYQYLQKEKNEYVLSKQLLRCGTSIGALVAESENAQSKADFINKLNIALKEANETQYWLSLMKDSEIIDVKTYDSIFADCSEIVALLVAIIKTSKKKDD